MTSDSSDSPLVLTPDSTGTGIRGDSSPDSSAVSASAGKRSRRQTAFYPSMNSSNKPQKPFSRSAAKRESVMALGSIEHLQYFFTKTGLAAKRKPLDKAHLGLVPAIGGKGHVPSAPSITSISDIAPRPAIPEPPKPLFSPHVKNYEVDPESLLPGVIDDLVTVAKAWKLGKNRCDEASQHLYSPFDVLQVLKTTTRAIRSTRNYLLSLPDESADTPRTEVQYRAKMLGPRIREPSSTTVSSSMKKQPTVPDSIARIRRSALDVLTVLRQLEEFYRLPLEDEAYDAHSEGDNSRIIGTSSTPLNGSLDLPIEDDRATNRSDYDPDMSISFSIVQVQGEYKSIPVWEDDDDDSSLEREERTEKKDGWEERLVLGTGWLYKQDVKLSDLQTQRAIVASYLDIVDEVLFCRKAAGETSADDERGWERVQKQREWKASLRGTKNRRVSAADGDGKTLGLDLSLANSGKRRVSAGVVDLLGRMRLSDEPGEMGHIHENEEGDEELSDDDLPEWARRSTFVNDRLGRAHTLLSHLLPPSLKHTLGRPDSRNDFLQSLTSGQLLCVAYNTCVRKSKKPWGFVNKDGIHDILALEKAKGEEGISKKVWTFRRIDNLRLWVGALKLRYMLPIRTPSQPLSTLSQSPSITFTPPISPSAMLQSYPPVSPVREPPFLFDAKVVAKREDGWEDMLEIVLFSWMEKVVSERRIHH